MDSKRMMNCSVCEEAKSKLTMIDGNLYCTQCMQEMMEEDIKFEPQPEDGMKIEDENGFDYAQQADSLGKLVGNDEFTAVIKEETEFDEEVEDGMDIEDENAYTQQTDSLGENVGHDEFTAVFKEETEFGEEADISKDTGLLMESDTEDLQAEIDIKEEITIEETQVNIEDEDEDDVEPRNAEKELKCSYCDLHYRSHRAYRVHIRESHREDVMVTCSICNFTCKGEKLYKAHIQEEHDGFECMCQICEELYHSGQDKSHKQRCKGRLLFQCKSCKDYYGKKESVWKHLDEHGILENDKKSSYIKLRIKERVYFCKICQNNKVFRQGLYWKHIMSVHGGHHLCCERCLKTFRTPASRSYHTCKDGKTDSSGGKIDPTVDYGPESTEKLQAKEFKFPEGPKIYPQYQQEATFSCDICWIEFTSKNLFFYHKKTVHTEPEYTCPDCQKMFHYESVYRKHSRIHQKEKNQVQNGSAVDGADQPGNAKPKQISKCNYCGISFVSHRSYRAHLKKSHPEDRKIFCSICFFSCQGDTLYREHIREKHGGFECMCKICLELYHSKTYEDHKKQCQGRLVFRCNSCQECYGKKESLWKHLDGHGILEDSKEQSTTECRIKEHFYSCKVCEDDKLYERVIYWKHIKNVHKGCYMRCEKCPQIFKTATARSKHNCTVATDNKANIQVNSVPKHRRKREPVVVKEVLSDPKFTVKPTDLTNSKS